MAASCDFRFQVPSFKKTPIAGKRRVSSRIVARAVAAEVTRRKCFSRQNPPPYVGGYHSGTHPGTRRNGWLVQARSVPVLGRRNAGRASGVGANRPARASDVAAAVDGSTPPNGDTTRATRHAPIAARNTASSKSDVALLACLVLAATVAASADDRFNSSK